MIQKLKTTVNAIAVTAIALTVGVRYLRYSQLLMPTEYKDIKTIVNKLGRSNNLGKRAITFSVTPGSYLEWYAMGFKLCEKDQCTFYGALDPFKKYKGAHAYELNDAIRQAFIYANIEAYASSSGTIEISRSTFRVYGKRKEFLACTIAHELDHFITNDQFEDNLKANKEIKDIEVEDKVAEEIKNIEGDEEVKKDKDEKENLITSHISRLSEVDADNGSTLMMFRAGYPLETCLNNTYFVYRIAGLGKATKPKDTDPGYEDRVAAMQTFIEKLRTNPPEKYIKPTKGKWLYRRDLNTLTFTPLDD